MYRQYVTDAGLEFFPLAGDPAELSKHMVNTGGRLIPLTVDEVKAVPEKLNMVTEILHSTFPACTQPDPGVA